MSLLFLLNNNFIVVLVKIFLPVLSVNIHRRDAMLASRCLFRPLSLLVALAILALYAFVLDAGIASLRRQNQCR